MSRPDHLFVYGTLMTTAGHALGQLLREKSRFVVKGSICARLYMIDEPDGSDNRYPGALPSPDPADRVYGEVYEILDPDPVFDELDKFEACAPGYPEPFEFLLREIDVATEDGGSFRAGCYLYTWDVSGAERIPSGRYEGTDPTIW